MTLPFSGKNVIVVSGGTSGKSPHIGRACAAKFAEQGAHVVSIDESADANAETLRSIEAAGSKGTSFVVDTTDEAAMSGVADECTRLIGVVHALVNAHMANAPGLIEHTTLSSWKRVLEKNVLGPVLSVQVFLPLLKKAGNGAVTHIGSIDGLLGNPSLPAYSTSKGSLVPLTHVMANELGRYGIRVNCVARCAVVGTNIDHDALNAVTPLGRSCRLEEIAAVTAFLSSDAASYVSGAVVPVDGGRIAITPGTFLRVQ
ncbi:MAG: SDR family NAD(P)-dependent oxidoreductase [Myxococcaceae bacterium]